MFHSDLGKKTRLSLGNYEITVTQSIRNISVCISGTGRSLENLIRVQDRFSFKVAAVISSHLACAGNTIAIKNNLPLLVADFTSNYSDDLVKKIRKFLKLRDIELVVLAGFLKKFPVIKEFKNKIINIHPALLPKFGGPGMYGSKVHQAVIAAHEVESGATVHWVDANYDEGKIISQSRVQLSGLESLETLANKVFAIECELLPKTIDEILKNNVKIIA